MNERNRTLQRIAYTTNNPLNIRNLVIRNPSLLCTAYMSAIGRASLFERERSLKTGCKCAHRRLTVVECFRRRQQVHERRVA